MRQVLPQVGPEVIVPGSADPAPGSHGRVSELSGQRLALTPDGRLYVLYCTTYLNCNPKLWRVGAPAGSARKVPQGQKDPFFADLAAGPDGRLWVGMYLNVKRGEPDFPVVRTNPAGTAFGTPRFIESAGRLARRGLVGMTLLPWSATRAEILGNFGFDAGDRLYWAQVRATFRLSAKPTSWSGKKKQKVTFSVTDAGAPVPGAEVAASGKRCRTGANGRCSMKLPRSRPHRVTAKATHAQFDPATLILRVR